MKRREFVAGLIGVTFASPLVASAQQATKPQIGFLYPGPQAAAVPRMAALLSGLQAGGFGPEQLILVPRITGGNASLLTPMASELVDNKVDVIIAIGPAAVSTTQTQTRLIPIVASDFESDPVSSGFAATVARPDGNVTGVFLDFPDFSKKWVEVLKEGVPKLSHVAVLWDPSTGSTQREAVVRAIIEFGLTFTILEVRERTDFEPAVQAAVQGRMDGAVILSSPLVGANTKLLADIAAKYRLPVTTLFPDFAREGGLMAYGPNLLAVFRLMGVMVSRILRGAKAAEMPIEKPTKFEFVLNLKAANHLGLTIPPSILLRADEVIE